MESWEFLSGRIVVATGDITDAAVDAIVNAANSTLLGGGGVDGAIHAKGGGKILAECREIRSTHYPDGLPTGEAVITTGGDLPARYVIHTVGPIYGAHSGKEDHLLANCYGNSLRLAAETGLSSVAFPAISTGVYRFPKPRAAAIASASIARFLASSDTLEHVRLVFFNPSDTDVFLRHADFDAP